MADQKRDVPEATVLDALHERTCWYLAPPGHASVRDRTSHFDHDLGEVPGVGTGYDVLNWIEEQAALHGFGPPEIDVHSANPGARPKMEAAIESIRQLAKE